MKVQFEKRDLWWLLIFSWVLLVVGCVLIGSWRLATGVLLVVWGANVGEHVRQTANQRRLEAKLDEQLAEDLCPVCGELDCPCCPIPTCHTPGCTSSHK